MGKKRGNRKPYNKPKPDVIPESTGYEKVIMQNALFEQYYKAQNIVQPEEWEDFLSCIRTGLPTAFRVHPSIVPKLNYYFDLLKRENTDPIEVYPLKWYPDEMAYHLSLSRIAIKKNPLYKKFKDYIVCETAVGNVSRQEAVSMIPPLLLDVKPEHYVLDMCAAPGSKTAQLIEALHRSESLPTGLVIANDFDNKRAYMLIHQVKRLTSPSLIITNHDASMFPTLLLNDNERLQFDRILCDVPCSGDGTIRKNMLVWKKWSVANAFGQHNVQKRILERGCQLLKVGGRIVYSTCSLNPVENEAVVSAILKKYPDSLRLMETANALPGLKRRPGLNTWKVMNAKGEFLNEPQENMKESVFPLPKEELDAMNIQRCMRLVPHDQNTGGFFVAIIEKVAPLSKNEERNLLEEEEQELIDKELQNEIEFRKRKHSEMDHSSESVLKLLNSKPNVFQSLHHEGAHEEPFIFLNPKDHPFLNEIKDFYGMQEFPFDQCVVRSEALKTIYYVNSAVKKVLLCKNRHRLVVVNSGVKAFSKCEKDGVKELENMVSYRIQQEAIEMLDKYITKRRITISNEDLLICLSKDRANFDCFSKELQASMSEYAGQVGTFLFDNVLMPIVVWKGRYNIQGMIVKQTKESLLIQLKNLLGKDDDEVSNEEARIIEASASQVNAEENAEK